MVLGYLTRRMGEPGEEGLREVAEGGAEGTEVEEMEREGTEMGRGKEAKERSLPPVGLAVLKESRSYF